LIINSKNKKERRTIPENSTTYYLLTEGSLFPCDHLKEHLMESHGYKALFLAAAPGTVSPEEVLLSC
jgi:hypothetical protein